MSENDPQKQVEKSQRQLGDATASEAPITKPKPKD